MGIWFKFNLFNVKMNYTFFRYGNHLLCEIKIVGSIKAALDDLGARYTSRMRKGF